VEAIANQPLQSFATVPIEAVRLQAENGARRLATHSEDFRNKASALVEQGLVQGLGVRKVAGVMRSLLGTTKGKAESLVRTETLAAHNDAALANYSRNSIQYVQLFATADRRLCPICAARNQQVYKLGESQPPLHPKCRCQISPYIPAAVELGLIDAEWSQKFRADAIAKLKAEGGEPDNGPSPFEKAAGQTKAPVPFWKP
jgi:SPP1 gp7 family putative phage head morphogenesis protein